MIFDHEWRADAPPYAGRHRKGWLAASGGRRRGYRRRIQPGLAIASPPTAQPGQRHLQVAGRDHGSQAR